MFQINDHKQRPVFISNSNRKAADGNCTTGTTTTTNNDNNNHNSGIENNSISSSNSSNIELLVLPEYYQSYCITSSLTFAGLPSQNFKMSF